MRGRITKWTSKREDTEKLSVQWELGSGDDEHVEGQVTYTHPEVPDLSNPSGAMGKFLSDSQYFFTLESYTNGTPAPSVVTKEVHMTVTVPLKFDG